MIVVVGAGIGGLASALALSAFSEVLILERRSSEDANAGAGIQLSPNAIHALRFVSADLAQSVTARASTPSGLQILSGAGRSPLAAVDYRAVMNERHGAPYLTIARRELYQALVGAVGSNPRIALKDNTPVSGVERVGGGWRVAGLAEPCCFLVAADGVNSAVRGAVRGDGPIDTRFVAWRGTGRTHADVTSLTMMHDRHLVRYALREDADNVVLVEKGPASDRPAALDSPQAFAVEDASGWRPWPIAVREPHWFGEGTLAAVGDASHAMVPFLAQGGAMVLEDAAQLKADVSRFGLTAAAVDAYAKARAPRIKQVAAQAKQQGLIYHVPAPASWVRDLVIKAGGERAVLRRVDWIYRWRPAV
ncbi:MAG: FAD-dependent monooxygenase [Pseudomonadota bacterium]